jgi:serine/threonine protein kinase
VADRGPEPLTGVQEGDVLAGKYRVERVLGVGGMGVVVAAHHIRLDMKVALKFLLPAMLGDAEAVGRFAREARAAVRITNEHVARVTDVGTLDNGAPYIVMEYLEGEDLSQWLRQRGPLPIDLTVDFVLQACVAIADAHGLGIVHRDLKPANLFCCVRRSDGQSIIKVLDFGISKVSSVDPSSPEGSVTQTGALMGSPLYMSPEQMRSPRSVDAQTDIWAVGVILFQLLTGRVPFEGKTIAEVAVKAAAQPPPPMRDLRPDVPAALEAVIRKCLEKPRHQRYANVSELALALAPFAPRRSRVSIEQIAGILQSTGASGGLSTQGASPAQSAQIAFADPGTISPVGPTTHAGTTSAKTVLAVAFGALGLLSVASFTVFRFLHGREGASSALPAPSAVESGGGSSASPERPPPSASGVLGVGTSLAPPPVPSVPSAKSTTPAAPIDVLPEHRTPLQVRSASSSSPSTPRAVSSPASAPSSPAASPADVDPLSKLRFK